MSRERDLTFPGGGLRSASCSGGRPKLGSVNALSGGGGVHGKRPQMAKFDQNELGDGSFETGIHEESMRTRNHVPRRS